MNIVIFFIKRLYSCLYYPLINLFLELTIKLLFMIVNRNHSYFYKKSINLYNFKLQNLGVHINGCYVRSKKRYWLAKNKST